MKLRPNTDSIDISQKCLGISPNYYGPETDNRGLHIQIRHNGSKEAYNMALKIQKVICAAPELVTILEETLYKSLIYGEYDEKEFEYRIRKILTTIK